MKSLLALAVGGAMAFAAVAADEKKPADPVKKEEPKKDAGYREIELKDVKAKEGAFGEPTSSRPKTN